MIILIRHIWNRPQIAPSDISLFKYSSTALGYWIAEAWLDISVLCKSLLSDRERGKPNFKYCITLLSG